MFELSAADGTIPTMAEFTDEHRAILDFERSWWKYAGAKEAEVHARFAMTATRYYQVLNWVIDQPEAIVHDPLTTRRLQRLRDQQRAIRTARRRGFQTASERTVRDPLNGHLR